jgi:hypothetical protein
MAVDGIGQGDALAHIDELERSVAELRRVADHAGDLPAALLEPELAEAVAMLRRGFVPEQAVERRLAATVGGSRLAELVQLGHVEIDRRLGELIRELDALRAGEDGDPAARGRRLARTLYSVEALVGAQLTAERWLVANSPLGEPAADPAALTQCAWCGAEHPVPR